MSKHQGSFKNSEVEKLSSELKFVSKIRPGQRIDISSKTIQDNTYWTSATRTVNRWTTLNRKNIESREKIYKYVVDVIQDSLSMLESLSNSANEYDIEICRNLISDLVNVRYGLLNLQITYKDDQMYVSRLETLLQTDLDVKLRELCSKRRINFDEIVKVVKETRLAEKADEEETEENKSKDKDSKTKESESTSSEESSEEEEESEKKPEESKKKETIKVSPVASPQTTGSRVEAGRSYFHVLQEKKTTIEQPKSVEQPKPAEPKLAELYKEVKPVMIQKPAVISNPNQTTNQTEKNTTFNKPDSPLKIHIKLKDDLYEEDTARVNQQKRRTKNPAYQFDHHYFMNHDDDIIIKNADLEKGAWK